MDNLCISNARNETGDTGGAETTYSSGAPHFTPVFNGVRVDQSLVACVVHCRSLFVLFYFIAWPWYYLSFFHLDLLITHLITSNFFLNQIWSFLCNEMFQFNRQVSQGRSILKVDHLSKGHHSPFWIHMNLWFLRRIF